ncbi:MAG: gamma-glutamyltransferase [Bacteroidota bacterium]
MMTFRSEDGVRHSMMLRAVCVCVLVAGIALPLAAASRRPVKFHHGLVVTADSLATSAGRDILMEGGNAVDAAVAAGFVLAVTYPEAGNLGGGGFMLIRRGDGTAVMIDFREKAPGAASRDMYLDSTGVPVPQRSLLGPLAAGVPGTVAGLLHALAAYGTKDRERVLRFALQCAERGFTVDERLAASFSADWTELSRFPSSMRAFSRQGTPPAAGETLRQPDLAETLCLIIARGTDGFYAGPVAEKIVEEVARNGGIMTASDLAAYRPVERTPLRGTYRGYEILTASPPSAGGIALLQILNTLEQFDVRRLGWNSSRALHLFASACQRAFADRSAFVGDPDAVAVPVDSLITKAYAVGRFGGWDSVHAVHGDAITAGSPAGNHQTTHLCTADQWGNVVSMTYTLNSTFGCKDVVEGAGFLLNNEMDDFSVKRGAPNVDGLPGGEPNSIAPGKRMVSSMCPTIVLKHGRPFMAVGARGGSRIPTAVTQIISNVVDHGMDIQEAVDAPRVHMQWHPDTMEHDRRGLVDDVLRNLGSMGYNLKEVNWTARVEALMIDSTSSYFLGGPDPRENGVALGY